MIIGSRDRIYDGEAFAHGLSKALRAVVRVSFGSGARTSISTGWLLTPHLVMVPGYAVDDLLRGSEPTADSAQGIAAASVEAMEIIVQAVKRGKQDWIEEVEEPPELLGPGLLGSLGQSRGIALLRLATRRPGRLELSFESREPGDFVSLLHFPAGRQTTSVSFGRLLASEEPSFLAYDADTLPGSGGAPVLDSGWTVVAMHIAAGPGLTTGETRSNRGLCRAALVEALQQSTWWPEIASHHHLADVGAARRRLQAEVAPATVPSITATDNLLVRTALTASIDPTKLPKADSERLRPHVVDSTAKRWVLPLEKRQEALQSVGTLEKLRKLLPGKQSVKDASRAVVERILAGPPYDLTIESEDALSWWIQASRWFEGVAKDLPTPAQITRALERRRVRSRLTAIAGPGFRGRADELDTLRRWFAREPPVPLSVTGIGGVGKSALVARFVSELPGDTLLLWLDFDRADLAPDDAVSVLAALVEQASVQIEGFQPPTINEVDWLTAAEAFGTQVAAHFTSSKPPLLVLDSFEVAQYTERHEELWPVLEAVAAKMPALRLVVTGRAPVRNLTLLGRAAESLPLEGLAPADARAWLREKGITRDDVLERVVELADGIPLILRLALQLIQSGGNVDDLPETLPRQIVVGFLYDRILDRVQDPEFKPVATAALVLRRLTVDMIGPVFGGLVELPAGEPEAWFADLGREMALVEGTDVLRLRPEVRAATLKLLERDQVDLVRAVDERAAAWYAAPERDANDVEMAAELVYHRLRLGDVSGAEAAWRDGCGALLLYAAEEIPQAGPRAWLEARLGAGTAPPSMKVWELEASERIRSSRKRGLKRAASKILEERIERTDDSPLVFHEAFEERSAAQPDAAARRLDGAGYPTGSLGRDRRALRALLAAEQGDRRTAEQHLSVIDQASHWEGRRRGELEALAVRASRVRLATDLDTEEALLNELQSSDEPVTRKLAEARRVLSPVDLLLPELVKQISTGRFEVALRCRLSEDPSELDVLASSVEKKRRETLPEEPPAQRQLRSQLQSGESGPIPLEDGDHGDAATRLMHLGWRRWRIGTTTPFLATACRLVESGSLSGDPLASGILSGLAVFTGGFHGLVLIAGELPLFDLLQRAASKEPLVTTDSRWKRAERIVSAGTPEAQTMTQLLPLPFSAVFPISSSSSTNASVPGKMLVPVDLLFHRWKAENRAKALVYHLLAPDPLEHVVLSLAGESQAAY